MFQIDALIWGKLLDGIPDSQKLQKTSGTGEIRIQYQLSGGRCLIDLLQSKEGADNGRSVSVTVMRREQREEAANRIVNENRRG